MGDVGRVAYTSQFTVGTTGSYTTIQSAIDAAALIASSGDPETVWIWPGLYTEDLTLVPWVNLSAASDPSNGEGVAIIGNSVYADPSSGSLNLTNIGFIATNGTPTFDLQSTVSTQFTATNCYFFADATTAFQVSGSGMTVRLKNCLLAAGSGAKCANIQAGITEFDYCNSSYTDTRSTISGGRLNIFYCNSQDAYNVTGGTINAINSYIENTSNFSGIALATGTTGLVLDCIINNTGATYSISGLGNLTYGNLIAFSGLTIDPGLPTPTDLSTSITTINGDSGSITGSSVTIFSNTSTLNAGCSVNFTNSGTTSTFNVTDGAGNTIIGKGSGNATVSSTSAGTTCLGSGALLALTSGQSNTVIGYQAGQSINTGLRNTILGAAALSGIDSGSYNISIGRISGQNYTSSESNNIIIGSVGVIGDSNIIRIGTQGSGTQQQNKCFIAGIYNNNSSGFTSPLAVYVDSSTGQLGYGSSGGGSVTVNGDSGSASGSTLTLTALAGADNCGASVNFSATGSTVTLNVTDANHNTYIGLNSANAASFALLANSNVFLGEVTGNSITTDNACVLIGYGSGSSLQGSTYNTFLGTNAGNGIISGSYNTILGPAAGTNCTGSESGNVYISSAGVMGESNTTRINDQGNPTNPSPCVGCYIGGIQGVTVTGAAVLVDPSTDQLGVAVSSRRFKDNIKDMGSDSSPVMSLRPVTFNYTVGEDHSKQFGLIAEEVNEIMPELVVYDKEGLPQTVQYHNLPAILLNEIQKLNRRIEILEKRK